MTAATRNHWMAFQVGCTYVGTVVGAGFASGREIYQFFGQYGNFGYAAILITTVLFAVLGYRLMKLGSKLQAKSFRDVNAYLFGPVIGAVVDTVLMLMLFGMVVAMLAGAGELFHERLRLDFQIGVVGTALVTFFTVIRGIAGVLRANTVIVPTMMTFVLVSSCYAILTHPRAEVWSIANSMNHSHSVVMAFISCVVYSALNIGLASGVLIPLGGEIADESVLKRGALMGALGLGGMLLAVLYTLFAYSPNAILHEIPMGYISAQFGGGLQWLFVAVLWGEIYSTLVGNAWAIETQFRFPNGNWRMFFMLVMLLVAYVLSQIGFSNMVKYGYTVFGWISMLLIIALLWPRNMSQNR